MEMTSEELTLLLAEIFPQVGDEFIIEEVGHMRVRIRQKVSERHLRPGGTVSGPTLFGLADVAVYVAVMAMIGPEALAVTTNASIDFMRKPASGRDVIAEAELLKLGRSLAVGDVRMHSEGDSALVARASLTYSIPPKSTVRRG